MSKRVSFSYPLVTQCFILSDDKEDRNSQWEILARDRIRFAKRIRDFEKIFSLVLKTEQVSLV